MHKNSIYEKRMQLLRKIAILYIEYNIQVQLYWISTKQNCLADMLSRNQYQDC